MADSLHGKIVVQGGPKGPQSPDSLPPALLWRSGLEAFGGRADQKRPSHEQNPSLEQNAQLADKWFNLL